MRRQSFKIIPMTRSHRKACDAIVAGSEPWKTLGEELDLLPYIAAKQAYVCMAGGVPAGFVIFTPDPVFARGGYLRAIAVAPDMRKLGIGKALLSFAEERTARKASNLYLCASSFNRSAQRFYENLGYTKVGTIPGLIREDASEYIYWKQLHAVRPKSLLRSRIPLKMARKSKNFFTTDYQK